MARIPLDIQARIKEYLPVASLLEFRKVSPKWKSTIESYKFIADHTQRNKQGPTDMVISYEYGADDELPLTRYVRLVDDVTFPEQKNPQITPSLFNGIEPYRVVGSSHGLLCLLGDCNEENTDVWNLSIEKCVGIRLPRKEDFSDAWGFGVIPDTIDPMIVQISRESESEDATEIPCRVFVFTLSSGKWRVLSENAPIRDEIAFTKHYAAIGQCIYWGCSAYSSDNSEAKLVVVSFDMKTQEFREIYFPYDLDDSTLMSLLNLNQSLVVVARSSDVANGCDIWNLRDALFVKLYTIEAPKGFRIEGVLGFRNTGEPIVELNQIDGGHPHLAIYKPFQYQYQNLQLTQDNARSFSVNSYKESLVLLNHGDNFVFPAQFED